VAHRFRRFLGGALVVRLWVRGLRTERYKGRNKVETCFNQLKEWCGIAMRSDKFDCNYGAAICIAAILIWIKTDLINGLGGPCRASSA
jgi:transposase